jgi:hypothetical protein
MVGAELHAQQVLQATKIGTEMHLVGMLCRATRRLNDILIEDTTLKNKEAVS